MATYTRTEHKLETEGLAPNVSTLRVVALMSSQVAKYTGVNIPSWYTLGPSGDQSSHP